MRVVSRNVYVVKDPNSRHAQLVLSDDLIGRRGSLGTSPDAYRAGVRALFAAYLLEPQATPLIADDLVTDVPIALVPALGAEGDHVLVPEAAWASTGAWGVLQPFLVTSQWQIGGRWPNRLEVPWFPFTDVVTKLQRPNGQTEERK